MMVYDAKKNLYYDDGETLEQAKMRKNRIKNIMRMQDRRIREHEKEMAQRPRCSCGMILPRVGIRCMCGK